MIEDCYWRFSRALHHAINDYQGLLDGGRATVPLTRLRFSVSGMAGVLCWNSSVTSATRFRFAVSTAR